MISMSILLLLMFWYGVAPSIGIWFFLPMLLVAIATVLGLSLWLSALYVPFRDVGHLLPFLVTIWILNVTFLPKMLEASGALTSTGNVVESPLAADLPNVVYSIRIAFFIACIVHALGDGILAGVLDTGKIPNGLRHSCIMLVIALLAFLII